VRAYLTLARFFGPPRVCRNHGGAAPQVKRKASQRLADLIDPDRALREAARLAYSDVRELVDPDTGRLRPMKDWSEHVAAAVSSIEVTNRNLEAAPILNGCPASSGRPISSPA
jgi:hypothetical protein